MAEDFREDSEHVLRVAAWLDLSWLSHGFGSRHSEQWNHFPAVTLKQIHSDICVKVAAGQGIAGEGDALLTNTPSLRISIRTADCVPIILVDTTSRAIAVIHAGWRGTVQRIAVKAVAAMNLHFGTHPSGLLAAIGPAIGPCCYEVGGEVAAQFQDIFPERNDLGGKTRLDLPEANRRHLFEAGVQANAISFANRCTYCSGSSYHSWRRDGVRSGRMITAAAILQT